MKQKVLYPKVVRGGKAVPLGNNFYYMSGRKHKDGGIDVGSNPRTGLEVEDEEIMHITPKEAKVFSSVPFLNGKSPAEKVMNGESANKVFNAQENYKDRKGLNDDGTKKKESKGGNHSKKELGGEASKPPFRRNRKLINSAKKQADKLLRNEDGDTLFENVAEFVDFTGISSWDDVYRTLNDGKKGTTTPEVLGAIPLLGKTGKAIKGAKKLSPHAKLLFNAPLVGRAYDGVSDFINLGTTYKDKKEFGGKTMIRKKKVGGGSNPNKPFGGDDNIVTPFGVYGYDQNTNDTNPNRAIDFNNDLANSNVSVPTTSSTGEQPKSNVAPKSKIGNILDNIKGGASKAGKAIATYARENPGDAIGIGSNVVGGLISAGINKRMLKSLEYAKAPAARQATKLKTTININPQIDKMRETLASYERDIDNNTGSSRVALARKQRARLAGMLQTNELFGAKENAETELINKDRLNQQAVAEANLQDYNRWSENQAQFKNAVREKRAENKVGVFETINSAVQDGLTRSERRKANDQNIRAIAAGNPNVSPEILETLGIKMPKNLKEQYKKAFGKKNAKKG